MIADLKKSFEGVDVSSFELLLHDIKSTGGNFGFMLVTDLASMIKIHSDNNNRVAIAPLLDELEGLYQRMQLGLL